MTRITFSLIVLALVATATFGQTATAPTATPTSCPQMTQPNTGFVCWGGIPTPATPNGTVLPATLPGTAPAAVAACGNGCPPPFWFTPLLWLIGGGLLLFALLRIIPMFRGGQAAQAPATGPNGMQNLGAGQVNVNWQPPTITVSAVPYVLGGPTPQFPQGGGAPNAPVVGAPGAGAQWTCGCGMNNAPTARFCGHCGTAHP